MERVNINDPRGLNVSLYSTAYVATKSHILQNIKNLDSLKETKIISYKSIDVPNIREIYKINFWLEVIQREEITDVAVVEVYITEGKRNVKYLFFLHNLIYKDELFLKLKCPLCSETVEVSEIETHLQADAVKKSCSLTIICLFCLYSSNQDCIASTTNSLVQIKNQKKEGPVAKRRKKQDEDFDETIPKEDDEKSNASKPRSPVSRMNIHNKKIKHKELFEREIISTFAEELVLDSMDPINALLTLKRSDVDGVLPQNSITTEVASILREGRSDAANYNFIGGVEYVPPAPTIISPSSLSMPPLPWTKTALHEMILKNYERTRRNDVFRALMLCSSETQLSEFLDSVYINE